METERAGEAERICFLNGLFYPFFLLPFIVSPAGSHCPPCFFFYGVDMMTGCCLLIHVGLSSLMQGQSSGGAAAYVYDT